MPTKECSKCRKELDISCFTKGRNKTGTYPSCRECNKEHRRISLINNPLCSKCKSAPHMDGDSYCYACSRKAKGRGEPQWVSRREGLEWCKVCGQLPRLPYHHYCGPCKNDYQNRTREKTFHLRHPNYADRHIEHVRSFAHRLYKKGVVKRGPCVFCTKQSHHFHHYDYEWNTRNFEPVCWSCHVIIHKFLRIVLTLCKNGAKWDTVAYAA